MVPIESFCEGGSVGRRERICEVEGELRLGKTY